LATLDCIFFQSCFTSGISHPAYLRSYRYYPPFAAKCISFLGIHPTFTQVPPIPHLVPYGLGLT